jgi:hypothetical protein
VLHGALEIEPGIRTMTPAAGWMFRVPRGNAHRRVASEELQLL